MVESDFPRGRKMTIVTKLFFRKVNFKIANRNQTIFSINCHQKFPFLLLLMNLINKVIITTVGLLFLIFLIFTSSPNKSKLKVKTKLPKMSLKSYIITLKDSASDSDVSQLKDQISKLGGEITTEYSLIKGFAAKLPEVNANSIKADSNILNVEEDQEVKIQ